MWTTFDIVHDMTCLDLFCKGQFVLNFSGGMPLSDSLSTFLTLIATAWLFYMYCLLPTKSMNMLVQGISWQRGQSNSGLVRIYIWFLLMLWVVLCFWDWDIYIKFISFYLFEDLKAIKRIKIYLQLKVETKRHQKSQKTLKKYLKILAFGCVHSNSFFQFVCYGTTCMFNLVYI